MDKAPFIPKEGKGRLFRNTRKEQGSNQPDWRGDAMFGQHIQVSGWDQEDGSISLSIQKKEPRATQSQRQEGFKQIRSATTVPPAAAQPPQEDDSDVPF